MTVLMFRLTAVRALISFTCSFTDSLIVALSTRLAVIVADIIVLAVTWLNTFATVKQASSAGIRVSISQAILRDGKCSIACC